MPKQVAALSNGIRMELVSGRKSFVGIGKVWSGKTLLRSGRRPMFVEVRTPEAVLMTDYRVVSSDIRENGIKLQFAMKAKNDGIMEFMVHEVRNRYNTGDWSVQPVDAQDTTLTLTILPVERAIDGTKFVGFSYQYTYRSSRYPIYKILDRSTWEPGGKAVGNEFWMRMSFVRPVTLFESTDQFYSTEWFLADCQNPNVFQFFPLQTEMQGFTFTAHPKGVLVTWPTKVAHVRSYFEKPRSADEVVHLHEHCGDLAADFATSPVEVLFAAGKRDDIAKWNLYESVKETVFDSLHAQVPMRREKITRSYGVMEEWGLPDFDRYREQGLPKLLEAGVRQIFLPSEFENNMNTWGVSNMCCTVDLKVAKSVGKEKLAAFCRAAQAAGAKVEMWGNTSLSTLTLIFNNRERDTKSVQSVNFLPKEGSAMEALASAKQAFIRNASNAIEADHYTPVFACMNLRDPAVREFWNSRWKAAHDEVGIEGIFLDSSFNLSSDKFHYIQNVMEGARSGGTADQAHLLGAMRPAVENPKEILTQYHAHLKLMADMQNYGYEYCSEDYGVFGIHRHGGRLDFRLLSLPMWTDGYMSYDPDDIRRAGHDPDDVFFRLPAYRQAWQLYWVPHLDKLSWRYQDWKGEQDSPTAWQVSILKAFNEVGPLMTGKRTILPKGKGVLYSGVDGKKVLWAFEDLKLPLDGQTQVRDVLSGGAGPTAEVKARQARIYVIG